MWQADMDRQEFSRQLEKVQRQIFYAVLSYRVYIALLPTTKEAEDTFNRRRGFFKPVHNALYQTMMMGFAKIFDTDRRTMSLANLLREAKEATGEVAAHLSISDIQDMDSRLSQHKPVLKKLKDLRDQQLAHNDANPRPSRPPEKGEMDNLIKTVEEVFNRLSSGHNKSVYSWAFQQNRSVMDTAEILRILQGELEQRKAETDRLLDSLGDN